MNRRLGFGLALALAVFAASNNGWVEAASPSATSNRASAAAVVSEVWVPPTDVKRAARGATAVAARPDPVTNEREVPGLATRTSRTFVEPDGSLHATLFPESVNYKDAAGKWHAIDNKLVPVRQQPYAYTNRANSVHVLFPRNLSDAPIRVTQGSDFVEFYLQGARADSSVSQNVDHFANALTATDLNFAVLGNGLQEDILIKNPSAPSSFSYAMNMGPELHARLGSSGQIEFVDRAGRIVFVTPRPFMQDAGGATSGSVVVKLVTAQPLRVEVYPDPNWLQDSHRAWPVTMDPSIYTTSTGATQDTYITNGASTCPGSGIGPNDCVGYSGGQSYRSLFQWDLSGYAPTTQILNASISLTPQGGSATGAIQIDALQLTQGWTNAATWATYDGVHNWTTAGGTFNSTPTFTSSSTAARWYFTKLAQGWVNGTIPNYGILLKESVEGGANVQYFESSYGDCYGQTLTCNLPQLNIYYDPPVGQQSFYSVHDHQLGAGAKLAVNLANGNLFFDQQDFSIQSTGLSLVGDHYNNTLEDVTSGRWQWSVGYDQLGLELYGDGSAGLDGTTGFAIPFAINPDGSFSSPTGLNATLVKNLDGTYTLTSHSSGEQDRFDNNGFLITRTDKNGNKMSFSYTNGYRMEPSSITDTQGRVTTLSYDPYWTGQIGVVSDPAGRQYKFSYDASTGNLITYTDPAGNSTHYGYLAIGTLYLLNQITDPKGNVTKFGYAPTCGSGGSCQVTSVTYVTNPTTGAGYTETFAYNVGNTVVTDANGNRTTYYYDVVGRTTKIVDALGNTSTASYDANSDPSQTTNASGGQNTYQYDALNNPTKVSAANGATKTAAYADAQHPYSLTTETNTTNQSVSYTYDTAGNVVRRTDPAGNTTTYTYNSMGEPLSVTDALGHTTSWQYDQYGDVTKITYPAPLGAETFTYDSLSRLASHTDGKGQKTTYGYDVLDHQTLATLADGSTVSASYDGNGNAIATTDRTGTSTRSYDALNRVIKETSPTGQAITYTWDGVGNLTSETDSGGTITQQFNAVNTPTAITDRKGGKTSLQASASAGTQTVTFPNGVTETFTSNTLGQVTKVSAATAGGAVLTSLTYSYVNPANGHATDTRFTVTDAVGNVTSYGYDSLSRLTSAVTKSASGSTISSYQYAYDPVGNITSENLNGTTTAMSYNGADQLTQAGTASYTYDGAGNELGNSAGLTFSYNALNQTSSITPGGGSAISMAYRGTGQSERVQAGSTSFQYDLGGVDSMTIGNGTSYFTKLPNTFPLSETTSTGTYYYLHDALGSVIGVTDSGGNVVNRYTYDPYGNTVSQTEAISNPFKWIGAVWDSATQLYKMGDRYYSSQLGRFTQVDPAHQCLNGYAYAGDDPINISDPSGDWSLSCGVYGYGAAGWGWWWAVTVAWCFIDITRWDIYELGTVLSILTWFIPNPIIGRLLSLAISLVFLYLGWWLPLGFWVSIAWFAGVSWSWPWNWHWWSYPSIRVGRNSWCSPTWPAPWQSCGP
jgi:RHS repeat-associated protein